MGLPDDSWHGGAAMRIAEVIGRVTLSRLHPQLRGGRLLLALPMPLDGPDGRLAERGEEVGRLRQPRRRRRAA